MYTPYARKAAAVTCSDTVGFAPCRWLSVKTAGDYTVLYDGDTVAVAVNLAAGILHPMSVKRVNSSGAAATTGVVAHY